MEFAIKRFLKGKVKVKYKEKLFSAIERVNLFRHNILNFIVMFYVLQDQKYNLSSADILTIFNVLKSGEKYKDKNCQFYKFYETTYNKFYFNKDSNLIDGSYLDQVIKLNINVIFSNIVNNIQMNFEKYLFRLLKTKINIIFKEQHDYNSLVKKCSYYEFSYNADNKDKVFELIGKLKIKEKDNFYNKDLLLELSSLIELKDTKKCKTKNNLFKDDVAKIKDHEKKVNIAKSLVKKILTGEKDKKEIENLDSNFKKIYNETKSFFTDELLFENFYKKLNSQPFEFVKIMIKINNFLEENNVKTFNVFPKSRNLIPKHVTFDTASLNVIFLKNKDYESTGEKKRFVYNEIFNFDRKMLVANKKYPFTGTIQTDGVSLVMIYTKDKQKKDKINQLKQQGLKKYNEEINLIKDKYNGLYEDEIKILIEKKNNLSNEIKILKSENKKKPSKKLDLLLTKKIIELNDIELDAATVNEFIEISIKEAIKKFKKDSENKRNKKEEENEEKSKEKFKEKIKNKKDLIKKLKEENKVDELKILEREKKEFYYIEDLIEKELEQLKVDNKMYFDLGKSRLFYGLGKVENKDKFIKYTNKERKCNLRTLEHKYNIRKFNEELKIIDLHEKLGEINIKSTNVETIKKNISMINEENKTLYSKYLDERLRLEKQIAYVDKQRTEKNMIDKIVKQYNLKNKKELKNIVAIMGDWKGCNKLKNSESTLGIGMKRMFRKYFKGVYLVDETNSSKLNHITHEEMQNLVVEIRNKNKKGEIKVINKRLHEVLTFKMDKKHISKCSYSDKKEEDVEVINGETIIKVNRYIQRDKNAVLNFQYFVKYYFENKARPEKFSSKKLG